MLPCKNVKQQSFSRPPSKYGIPTSQQRALGCESSVADLQSVAHESVWSTVEAPSGEHILSLCHVSFSMWGKTTHWMLQSHNEPLLRQTKEDQTIRAWWTRTPLTVENSVSCQLCESFISICTVIQYINSAGEWDIYILFSVLFSLLWSLLTIRNTMFVLFMPLCWAALVSILIIQTRADIQRSTTISHMAFFPLLIAFFLAVCKLEKVSGLPVS